MSSSTYFSSIRALLLEQGLGKTRANILAKKLESKGGRVDKTLSDSTTHILVGTNTRLARVHALLKVDSIPEGVAVLRADWLSACLTKKQLVSEKEYRVCPEGTTPKPMPKPSSTLPKTTPTKTTPSHSSPVKRDCHDVSDGNCSNKCEEESTTTSADVALHSPKAGMFAVTDRKWTSQQQSQPRAEEKPKAKATRDSDSDYVESEEELKEEEDEGPTDDGGDGGDEEAPPIKKRKKWICEMSSAKVQTWVNHNKHITDKLEELLVVYQNSGEKWRAMSTIKALQALKKHPKEITTLEEARSVPFVGERLAAKIFEIASSGNLRRLDTVDKEKERIIDMFKNIHGVGHVTAQHFYARGYRTLEDLDKDGVLNKVQKIGLKHYHDFLERMQREEVKAIEAKVRSLAHSVDIGLEIVTCGSYRRGKPTCGDVDILVTHCDGRSHKGVLGMLLDRGHQDGFLTDDLAVSNESNGSGKYLGVCKLAGEGRKYRRLDIMVVPYKEFALGLVHFTGSGHMNRSMRSKADKMGMSLSEHALCTGVIRKNGEKIFDGTPLPVTCEKDVFDYLGLEYREPQDRDWD